MGTFVSGGWPILAIFARWGVQLSEEKGSDSFKKAFKVGGTNSHFYKKRKGGQPPTIDIALRVA
jgi:hypothetical protein